MIGAPGVIRVVEFKAELLAPVAGEVRGNVLALILLLDTGCIVHRGAVPDIRLNIRPCSYIK